MKVTDKQTGCVLESDNAITTDSWVANPERFAQVSQTVPERRTKRSVVVDANEE